MEALVEVTPGAQFYYIRQKNTGPRPQGSKKLEPDCLPSKEQTSRNINLTTSKVY